MNSKEVKIWLTILAKNPEKGNIDVFTVQRLSNSIRIAINYHHVLNVTKLNGRRFNHLILSPKDNLN